jgi:hypothetical protein
MNILPNPMHLAPAPLGMMPPGVGPSFPQPPPLPPPALPAPPQPFQLPPPPPPPSWRGISNFVNQWPQGVDLDAFDRNCNAVHQNGTLCPKVAAVYPKSYLPVCKLHKKQRLRLGYCKAETTGRGACHRLIKWKPPFFELCDAHREWTGMPCHLLKLPTEIRMEIFSYLLPDRPISAWLDRSLRRDGFKCTSDLLLVSKQIHSEAQDVLYRTQPYTVSIQRNTLNMCGRAYYHDISGSQLTTPNSNPGRLPVRPPMLDKIKSIRIQITMIKPSTRLNRRGRSRYNWDEEVEIYDLRDSVQCLLHMLQSRNSLHHLSIVFCTQNQLDDWDDDRQLGFLKTVMDPLRGLRNILHVDMKCIYQCTDNLRMNTTQYILDHLGPRRRILTPIAMGGSPSRATIMTPNSNEFSLSNCFDTYGTLTSHTPMLDVTKRLHDHAGFLSFKEAWETEIKSSSTPPPSQRAAKSAFKAFRATYNTVDNHYFTRLPKGKEWMLHQARVAREKGDIQAIHDLRVELESKVQEYIELDRQTLKRKEASLTAGFQTYDERLTREDAALSSQSEAGYDSDSSVDI